MNLSPDAGVTPAARRHGSIEAMNAAYDVGMRFDGDIDIPVIDWRHYLEEQLDMHHSHQSFATRRRLQLRHDEDNQVIWLTDARPAIAFDQTPEAFEVIDEWIANIKAEPEGGGRQQATARGRPLLQHAGPGDRGRRRRLGRLIDSNPPGRAHRSSRSTAPRGGCGRPLPGRIFKCGLRADAAIGTGSYGSWVPNAAERERLMQIFPAGVCDWSKPDWDVRSPRRQYASPSFHLWRAAIHAN